MVESIGLESGKSDPLDVILATGGYDNTIRFWEAWSGICVKSINHPQSQINRLAISPDKRFLAVAGNAHVRLYDVAIATASHHHPPSANRPTAPPPSDRTAQQQQQAQTQAGLLQSFQHNANVTSVAWPKECQWFVTGSEDGFMRIWDTRTPVAQRTYDHKCAVNGKSNLSLFYIAIHPNQGEIISCDQSGAIKIWDLAADSCTHELFPEEDVPQRSVSIASDNSCLVAGNNSGNVFVWNISTSSAGSYTDLQAESTFEAHKRYCLKVLLSPDVRQLATCSADTTIKIWTLSPHSPPTLDKTLYGHQRWVWDLAFSADSAYLVSASSDHSARLWELASGQTVRQYSGHSKPCVAVALNDS
ncbi:WD repeat-containing protein pop3 [Phakopsora pachyrhizi]|uniref:Protein LST8 homolog n=1 Tax=Phakopsora pachyrhizi TaxID=170000 RepID=A0AAV0AM28_PHAPC|nr:WD repeat-containing protein pop3 [Phakopsora pachyrhizi]CAH7668988.1 WD repeat-containing protein pop3 [Phakopsora pachyrhizi]